MEIMEQVLLKSGTKGRMISTPKTKAKNTEASNKGSLKFILRGKKLKGKFALVKLKNAAMNAWLLVKDKDEFAVSEPYNSEENTPKSSPINKALQKEASKPVKTAKPQAKPAKAESKKKRQLKTP